MSLIEDKKELKRLEARIWNASNKDKRKVWNDNYYKKNKTRWEQYYKNNRARIIQEQTERNRKNNLFFRC